MLHPSQSWEPHRKASSNSSGQVPLHSTSRTHVCEITKPLLFGMDVKSRQTSIIEPTSSRMFLHTERRLAFYHQLIEVNSLVM